MITCRAGAAVPHLPTRNQAALGIRGGERVGEKIGLGSSKNVQDSTKIEKKKKEIRIPEF